LKDTDDKYPQVFAVRIVQPEGEWRADYIYGASVSETTYRHPLSTETEIYDIC
jgi:hypothetical protein